MQGILLLLIYERGRETGLRVLSFRPVPSLVHPTFYSLALAVIATVTGECV